MSNRRRDPTMRARSNRNAGDSIIRTFHWSDRVSRCRGHRVICGDGVWMYAYPQGWETRKLPDTKSAAACPEYTAFRTTGDGGRLVTVVDALEPADGPLFPWAMQYHAQVPRIAAA